MKVLVAVLMLSLSVTVSPLSGQSDRDDASAGALWPVDTLAQPFFGDLPALLERRVIRVLVSYNNTNYFIVQGEQKGMEYELMRRFEAFLNQTGRPADERVHLFFRSVPFEQLLIELAAGRGDVAAAGLTITAERARSVTFSDPYRRKVDEILVRHADAPAISALNELSGQVVHVLRGSSYADHLRSANDALLHQGLNPIGVVEADPLLEAEDILQLVHAGIYRYTIVDNYKADLWSQVLPGLVSQPDIAVHSGGRLAWAVRQDSPLLLEALNDFVAEHKQGTLLGNIFFKRYYQDTRWISNPLRPHAQSKIRELAPIFQKYAQRYDFDWLALVAQAYQESGLDQSQRSRAGAVGIMQIKPSTAADRNVAIDGVAEDIEQNIHAATKYLAFLRRRYFSDATISPEAQVDFTLAAYNAGPARIRGLRAKAAQAGLDPNRWFFNVEHIARREVGREPVDYVANIYKYYTAFRSVAEFEQQRRVLRSKLHQSNRP